MPQEVEVFPIIDVSGSAADYETAASNGVDARRIGGELFERRVAEVHYRSVQREIRRSGEQAAGHPDLFSADLVRQPAEEDEDARIQPDQVVETTYQNLTLWMAAREVSRNSALARRPSPLIDIEHVTLHGTLDPRLILLNEPGSDRARGYRLLRHRLFSNGDPRIVAVTSAHPGEGKTTCALNLALAIAEDTMTRTLLLEANLPRPALGEVFDFAPSQSIVEKIVRFNSLGPPYPVVSISGTRLHASALPYARLAGRRLDRTLFAAALSELREAYDYIVVDAASVLESGDVDVVGESSDAVIVAARAGRSSKRDLRRAIAQLAPAPVLGSVLIDA
ncbi:MAG TPA: CpsD/CapB family tyrosine-protein kinase [Polyangiaceae bacterium]|jgi:Mrp family chromosome partitioning ATPase|nr:CpsD/CapB family tyrosine-protein kinase [Polyangiaceae bacterium]